MGLLGGLFGGGRKDDRERFKSLTASPADTLSDANKQVLEAFVVRLIDLSHRTATNSGAGFLREGRPEAIAIGNEIDECAGFAGMVYVCDRLKEKQLAPGAARELEYVWNGIGEWRG
jgi:hypothetical protein